MGSMAHSGATKFSRLASSEEEAVGNDGRGSSLVEMESSHSSYGSL
jgi:hypothetical protein